MYIYERSEDAKDVVNIYDIDFNSDKIRDYKKKELEKIPEEERVIILKKYIDQSYCMFLPWVRNIGTENVENGMLIEMLSVFDCVPCSSNDCFDILNNYYDNAIVGGCSFYIPKYLEKRDCYVVSSFGVESVADLIMRKWDDPGHVMCKTSPVIQVTQNLYLLQLMINSNLSCCLKEKHQTAQMEELISLFELPNEPVKQVHLETLDELSKFGVIKEQAVSDFVRNVDNSSSLIKILKNK